mgnify:CR=1 FL=1
MHDSAPSPASGWRTTAALGGLCVGVIALYAALAWGRVSELGNPTPDRAYYNLLVTAFRSGQLNLPLEVPPGLAALPDPYNPDVTTWPATLIGFVIDSQSGV